MRYYRYANLELITDFPQNIFNSKTKLLKEEYASKGSQEYLIKRHNISIMFNSGESKVKI
jgi:hypothetical protein